jgi:hypothetical protein
MRTLRIDYCICLPNYQNRSKFVEVLIPLQALNQLILDGQVRIENGQAIMIIPGPPIG